MKRTLTAIIATALLTFVGSALPGTFAVDAQRGPGPTPGPTPPPGAGPSAPNLTASVKGTTVLLLWSRPSGAVAGYRLDGGLAPGSTIASNTLGPVTSFTAVLTPGTYYFRVYALDASGMSSPPSNEAVAVVGGGGGGIGGGGGCSSAPAPPVGVAFTVTGTLVSVRWNSGDSCPGTTYILHAGSAPGLSNVAIANVGAALSISASAPGGTYYVRIFAQNAFGLSAASSEVIIPVGGVSPAPVPPPTGGVPPPGGFWRPCSEVVRSMTSVTIVPIEFVNTSSQPRRLYWIDFAGTPQNYGVLSPGQSGFINSWVTHS